MSTAHVVDEALELQVFAREELVHLMKVRDFSTTELGVRCERSAHSIKCYAEGRADPPAGVVGLMAHAPGGPRRGSVPPRSPWRGRDDDRGRPASAAPDLQVT